MTEKKIRFKGEGVKDKLAKQVSALVAVMISAPEASGTDPLQPIVKNLHLQGHKLFVNDILPSSLGPLELMQSWQRAGRNCSYSQYQWNFS